MMQQRTIRKSVSVSGIGLHTGKTVTLVLHPAAVNTGIRFRRVDLPTAVEIIADARAVGDTTLSTRLVQGDVSISTIEHLMSAIAGVGIDNLVVELNALEVPILDGSAVQFVNLIKSAGLKTQSRARQFIRITSPIEVEDGDKYLRLTPSDRYSVDMAIDFNHPAFKASHNRLRMEITPERYEVMLAPARTFGFLKDIEKLRKHNLTLGGGLESAVVLDDVGVVNPEGLRFEDEFIRHKVLDSIGDLALLGKPLLAHLEGFKPGHGMNNKLARAVLAHPECWTLTTQVPEEATADLLVA